MRYSICLLTVIALASLSWALPMSVAETKRDDRPNILWITIEDWGPDMGCYATPGVQTPHVDKLASQGVRYQWAFTTSPVCSTSRSAMMTGYHQNFIGAHQHREYNKQPLPHGIKPIPHLLKEAGYYTALMSNKTDCNFLPDSRGELFEGTDWNQRGQDQPFFARITFGGTHRPWQRDPQRPIDPQTVEIPPYYPDTEFIRRDWANGLEQMQLVDREVGAILKRLDDEGLADDTLVFFIGDHGRCQIRGKQFLYDGGIRIPMIMRWPGKVDAGQVDASLASSLDICKTILDVANVKPVVPVHGINLLDSKLAERKYVFAARDKMDETHDAMRAIRSHDYKLILNLMPERPWCQYNKYKERSYPPLAELNVLHLQGKLNPVQAIFLSDKKPEIELFELKTDPHEINNLSDDPNYAATKAELLDELNRWRSEVIHDQGVSKAFTAADVFPTDFPEVSVDQWYQNHADDYDFEVTGWPAWYPTRTLESWQKMRSGWEPWVYRSPTSTMKRPELTYPHIRKKKKKVEKEVGGKTSSPVGQWALTMPDGAAGWLSVAKSHGKWSAELWTVGFPSGTRAVTFADETLRFTRVCSFGKSDYPGGRPGGPKVPVPHRAQVQGDEIRLVMECPLKDGSVDEREFFGKRLPPLPPAPNLKQVEFGDPIELFNGNDLTGWKLTNPAQVSGWKVEGGELVNATPKKSFDAFSKYGNLQTVAEFEDFNLRLEFNVPVGGNSGVYLRGMYEAQVVDRDSRMQGIQGVGAVFGRVVPSENAGLPGGQWQTYDLTLVDRHLTIKLNGKTVVDNQPVIGCTKGALSADITQPGPIYLQGDHTAVRYRNLVLRPVIER